MNENDERWARCSNRKGGQSGAETLWVRRCVVENRLRRKGASSLLLLL
jgi:hypothetical protein